MSKKRPNKTKAGKNQKEYLSSSVSGGRGKSIIDFMENFTKIKTKNKNKK